MKCYRVIAFASRPKISGGASFITFKSKGGRGKRHTHKDISTSKERAVFRSKEIVSLKYRTTMPNWSNIWLKTSSSSFPNDYSSLFFNLLGSSSLSSDWPEQSCEGLSSYYTQFIWEGDVWQSQSKAGSGQGCSTGHQPQKQSKWGKRSPLLYSTLKAQVERYALGTRILQDPTKSNRRGRFQLRAGSSG